MNFIHRPSILHPGFTQKERLLEDTAALETLGERDMFEVYRDDNPRGVKTALVGSPGLHAHASNKRSIAKISPQRRTAACTYFHRKSGASQAQFKEDV